MKKVFRFTMQEAMHGKGFYAVTFGVSFLLLVAGITILSVVSFFQIEDEDEKDKAKIEKVYVVNETDYDLSLLGEVTETQIEMSTKKPEEICKEINQSKKEEALVRIVEKKEHIGLTMFLKESSEADESGEELLEKISGLVRQSQLAKNNINPESLATLMAPVQYEYTTVGEEPQDTGSTLVKMLGPMLLILVMYFMIIVYGQSIAKTVSEEKTSKLMETLLLTVRPYDLIGGKVFAMAVVGIIQFVAWIAGLILGIVGGHYMGLAINPDFADPVWGAFTALKQMGIGTAFTVPAIIISVLSLCIGFAFYCVLAGLISSRISKAEDLSQGMGSFNILVIIGFFGSYFPQLQGKSSILAFVRWFPLTSAFSLPGDILIGNVSLWMGALMLVVLIIAMLILVYVTGKMYRNQVFYRR